MWAQGATDELGQANCLPSMPTLSSRSTGHSGLSLLNCGEHAFAEIQALPLSHALAEGISELMHLNGELT